MMKRRDFLLSGLGTGMALGLASTLPRRAWADTRPFTFTSWGGALSAAEKMAFMDPFAAQKGITINNTSPTETAKMKAMVTWSSVLMSFGISVAVGILFGLYPARRAALMDPIEALRHE